ncbi:MAG: PAS domain-containing sensor histidine kinase [Acidimicrobiales bacterium]|jgi:two-component sensor histidine kinase|nr:PAS domain-containing sensor histidine kinase [Acidimicrobiales bacterium]
MATTAELARYYTTLDQASVDHLQRLTGSWGLLADLCFSDLLLFTRIDHARQQPGIAEVTQGAGEQFVVLGQVRPLTSQTLYRADLVGEVISAEGNALVSRAMRRGEIIEEDVNRASLKTVVRELAIPVRYRGFIVGVLTREAPLGVGRHPGELERTYVDTFNRLARMVATGDYPFPGETEVAEEAPRVGDGAMFLDGSGRVAYASPNAISALHRVGVHANTEGMRLSELGLSDTAVREAFTRARPATDEIERGPEVTVLVRVVPLTDQGAVTGALVLFRDISELRRRDRLLLSKDATIREIHHRVKNNLQTIGSLLRLQARRLSSPEAKAALEESVRRIRSIAIVHETLSHGAGDDIPFLEIARPLMRMVEEGLVSPERPVRISLAGDPGTLPATVATPLSVVLTELLQNVVDHAFPPEIEPGTIRVEFDNDGRSLSLDVIDDGVGLPEGFSLDVATGLGLTIVRTLVTTELEGTIDMRRSDGDADRPGTVVSVRIPLRGEVHEEPPERATTPS